MRETIGVSKGSVVYTRDKPRRFVYGFERREPKMDCRGPCPFESIQSLVSSHLGLFTFMLEKVFG